MRGAARRAAMTVAAAIRGVFTRLASSALGRGGDQPLSGPFLACSMLDS
jgi:hypothetical protein